MRALSCVALLAACSSATEAPGGPAPDAPSPPVVDAAPAIPYPDPDWATGTPESVGLDPAKLAEAAAAAGQRETHCLLVIRHGILVAESYFGGATRATAPDSWSIAKSYTSTTVGIALGERDLPGLDLLVADYLPPWAATPRADIRLRHLLTMTSGLEWSIFSDYISMVTLSQDHSAFAVDLDADDSPGSTWTYHNGAVQVIEPLFRAATGQSIEDYARANLWSKIGMTAAWAKDPAGHPTTYANVRATCRDHARFGYLLLHRGAWKGEQVVPLDWVIDALSPSQAINQGYGYLFWLNGHGPTKNPMNQAKDEMLSPWAPHDLFSARGFGGQFIDVFPGLDMIVVRFGKSALDHLSTNPIEAAQALIADAQDDKHRAVVEPILQAVRE